MPLTNPITVAVLLGSLSVFAACEVEPASHATGNAAGREATLVEELRVGSIDGPDALTRVGSVLPQPDGGIWLVQPEARDILAFDKHGALTGRVGGAGEGPGEFGMPGQLGWWGGDSDTVWVSDWARARVDLFTRSGRFVRSFPAPQFTYQDVYEVRSPEVFLRDGTAFGMAEYRPGVQPWTAFPVLRYDAVNATPRNEVTRVDRTNTVQIRWESGRATGAHPIPDAPIIRFGRDRVMVLDRTVTRDEESRAVTIRMFGPDGSLLWSRRYPYDAVPLPSSEADSLIGERIAGFQRFAALEGRLSPEEAERVYRREVRAPAYRPPVRSAYLADDGRIWMEWAVRAGTPARWMVLNQRGELLASFAVPALLDVRAIHGDDVWAVETDDLDVPYLVRYKLHLRGNAQ
jgi:hypothetical protein